MRRTLAKSRPDLAASSARAATSTSGTAKHRTGARAGDEQYWAAHTASSRHAALERAAACEEGRWALPAAAALAMVHAAPGVWWLNELDRLNGMQFAPAGRVV